MAIFPLITALLDNTANAISVGAAHRRPHPIKLKPKQNKRHLFPSITRRDSVIASVAVIPGFSARIYGVIA